MAKNIKMLLALTLASSAFPSFSVSAHDAQAPGQDMERHDMSSMKGHSAGSM